MTTPHTGRTLRTNRTGVRGVSFNKAMGKYRAQIQINGARRYLGSFATLAEAAEAYLKAAGKPRDGGYHYKRRSVGGRTVGEHRLVWEAAHGKIPPGYVVDHIDGDVTNNALSNLRLATLSQNQYNKRRLPPNKHGLLGVSRCGKSSFSVRIRQGGKSRYLGTFATAEEAANAYAEAARALHGEYVTAALNGGTDA